jgi:hypothetical protein
MLMSMTFSEKSGVLVFCMVEAWEWRTNNFNKQQFIKGKPSGCLGQHLFRDGTF